MFNTSNVVESVNLQKCMNAMNQYILKPSTDKLSNYFKSSIINAEEQLLLILREHKDVFSVSTYAPIWKSLSLPLSVFYALVIIGLCALLWVPYILYLYLCVGDTGEENDAKESCGYSCKAAVAFGVIVFLSFTTAGCLQMGMVLDNQIREHVLTTSIVLIDVRDNMDHFLNQMCAFNKYVNNNTKVIIDLIDSIPKRISLMIFERHNCERVNEIINALSKLPCQMDVLQTEAERNLNEFKQIQDDIRLLQKNYGALRNFTDDKYKPIKDILSRYKIMTETYKFPDLLKIFLRTNDGIKMISNITQDLNTYNGIYGKIQMNVKNNISEIVSHVKNLENKFCETFYNISNKYEKFYGSTRSQLERLRRHFQDVHYVLSHHNIFGRFYISTFVFLIPGIHSMIFVLTSMIAFVLAIQEVKSSKIVSLPWNSDARTNSYSAIIFKIANIFGILLLWSGFFVAAACYLVTLSLSVTCRPLENRNLYSKYYDNKDVWNDATWIDDRLKDWGRGFKLGKILESCSKNTTIFEALKVEKYWNIEKVFNNSNIDFDVDSLTKTFNEAIKTINLPESNVLVQAKNSFQFGEEQIIINYTPEITYDVDFVVNSDLKNELFTTIANLPKKLEDVEVYLNNILKIIRHFEPGKVEQLDSLLNNIKQNLRESQENLYSAINLEIKTKKLIQNNASALSKNHINETSILFNEIVNKMKRMILHIARNEVGNCKFLPDAIDTEINILCHSLPFVLNATWSVLTLNSILMIVCMILNKHLSKHLVEKQNSQQHWKQMFENANEKDFKQRFSKSYLNILKEGKR